MMVRPASGLPLYSHIDDETLERLNALATAPEPAADSLIPHQSTTPISPRHVLSAEFARLIRDQVRAKRSTYNDALLATELRLVNRPWQEVEAVLDFGNIVEVACALVRLVGLKGQPFGPGPSGARHDEWQRELSRLLVRYPVLMDHRFAFAGYADTFDHAPLPHLLAHASFASLPCLSHGIAEQDLRKFASLSCVKAGLNRMSFVSKSPGSQTSPRTVSGVAFAFADPQRPPPAFAPATRGQFVASLLQLSELARQEAGRSIVTAEHGSAERDALYRSLATMFWDVAANGGAYSGITRKEFIDTLNLPSPINPQLTIGTYIHASERAQAGRDALEVLPYYIGCCFDRGLKGGDSHGVPAPITPLEHKVNGIRNAVGMLVEISLQPDTRAAAQWLAGQAIGGWRLSSEGSSPKWQPNEIMAVLEVLEEHGARVKLTADDTPPLGPPQEVESHNTWVQLIELHVRMADMAAIIAERTQANAAVAPESRRRRLAL